ncbi:MULTISPECIES: PspA/IM30 family protein [unclassified Paenibacillus]|uniref:PspA/IM30 family protein n=1 Tax=unclassified Paenibacillus TaxID=185978 RepID=UPI001C1047BB|nr:MULTISPECIES: PspA/IM30 family protein [unclassified Paenibacillus]MBU5441366.1 PspA/IM30 family protein [Paenibacillus sp. MSJ-34]CAH0118231.1 Protein LiaH [Paenibacillus sp. CECT 9249]
MSVIRRVRDITAATLNDRLERSEDPVRLIDQFLVTTKQEIVEAERLYQQYLMHANQMKQQLQQAQLLRDKREQQALLALKAEEEHIAKMALQEKIQQEEKIEQYTELYEQSKNAILELEDQINMLKSEYQTVFDKRQYYFARMESLRLQQRMNQRMGAYGMQDVPRMFQRLEDRVSDWELESRSLRDLRRMGQEFAVQAGTTLQSALDRELNRLKQKLEDSGKE